MQLNSGEQLTEMADIRPDVCEIQLNGVSELMELLQIDLETDVADDSPGKEDVARSVSWMRTTRKHLLASMGFHGRFLTNHYLSYLNCRNMKTASQNNVIFSHSELFCTVDRVLLV